MNTVYFMFLINHILNKSHHVNLAQAVDLDMELKKSKPDPLNSDLIARKNSLCASLDAAIAEFMDQDSSPTSWFAKGNFFQCGGKPIPSAWTMIARLYLRELSACMVGYLINLAKPIAYLYITNHFSIIDVFGLWIALNWDTRSTVGLLACPKWKPWSMGVLYMFTAMLSRKINNVVLCSDMLQ